MNIILEIKKNVLKHQKNSYEKEILIKELV